MGYRRIVLGTDGSATAAVAESMAASLASSCGSELVVVCGHGESGLEAQAAHDAVRRAADRARPRGIPVRTDVVEAAPSEALVETAEQMDAELIVVGHRGM